MIYVTFSDESQIPHILHYPKQSICVFGLEFPEARVALLTALTEEETSYQKVLNSLDNISNPPKR